MFPVKANFIKEIIDCVVPADEHSFVHKIFQ